jgi:site-specific DNA recombinase
LAAKRVVTYLRVSTVNQVDNTSIETQREKIKLYCKLNDIQIVEEFKDEAISAKHEHTREDYQRLIKFIGNKENKIDAIMVYKSDRIHRSLRNLMNMISYLQKLKIDFISITEQFDTSTAQGMLFLQMLGSFSEFERKLIAERTKSGRIANHKKELSSGGRPPFGYKMKDKKLIVNEEEAEIVKEIFKLRNKGKTLEFIGNKFGMSKQRIHGIIKNQTYTGKYTYNGKVEKNNFVLDVEPIVSRYTYNKANLKGRYL